MEVTPTEPPTSALTYGCWVLQPTGQHGSQIPAQFSFKLQSMILTPKVSQVMPAGPTRPVVQGHLQDLEGPSFWGSGPSQLNCAPVCSQVKYPLPQSCPGHHQEVACLPPHAQSLSTFFLLHSYRSWLSCTSLLSFLHPQPRK